MSKAPKTLTNTEADYVIEALLFRTGTPKQQRRGIRNAAIGLCMLDAGLRVGEVCRLRKSDLWFNKAPVTTLFIQETVAEKDAEREIPVSSRLWSAIQAMYQTHWSGVGDLPDHLAFYGKDPRRPLTTRQVERVIGSAARKALGRPIYPHVLRHTFASRLMRKTNSRIVQELLGHKHLSSTQIYCHPNRQDLANAINSLNEPATQ